MQSKKFLWYGASLLAILIFIPAVTLARLLTLIFDGGDFLMIVVTSFCRRSPDLHGAY